MLPIAQCSPPDSDASHVFYVSSHGCAGDHWISWFSKALNSHPEIMIFMGESSRQKYLNERSRKERPPLIPFTHFLAELGGDHDAIGECYAYRAYQLEELWPVFQDQVRFVNLVRHPYCWLHFYVTWRCGNLGVPMEVTGPIDHEWNVVQHALFKELGLKPYTRNDIEIWSSYQGMSILNRMVSDLHPGVRNECLERIVKDPELFTDIVDYLTHGRVLFDEELLRKIYGWVYTPFRDRPPQRVVPAEIFIKWPDWKKEAFDRIVNQNTRDMFLQYGYTL